jgi:lipopolysaccharide transport system permease protein
MIQTILGAIPMDDASTKVTNALEFSQERERFPAQESSFSKGLFRYYYDLILYLVRRDFMLRTKGSVLGVLWILVMPVMQLLTLVFVFKKIIPLNIDSYPAYVFTGLLPWTWFSSGLSSAGGIFVTNRDLVRHPNFEPSVLIIVNLLSTLLIYLLEIPLVFAVLLAYGHSLSWVLFLLPLFIVVQGIFIAGLTLMISTWNVFYRDVQQMVTITLTLLFWITPVFYRTHEIGKEYKFLIDFNPIAILIDCHRRVLFYAQQPQWGFFLYCLAISVCIAFLGYVIHKRQLNDVIDTV